MPARTSGSPHRSPATSCQRPRSKPVVEDVDPLDSAAEGELPRSCGGLQVAVVELDFPNSPAAYIHGRPDDNGAAAMPTAPTVFCRRRYAGRMPQHRRRPKVRSALPICATEVHETISSERRRPAAATTRRSTSWAPTGRSSSPPHYAKPLPPRCRHYCYSLRDHPERETIASGGIRDTGEQRGHCQWHRFIRSLIACMKDAQFTFRVMRLGPPYRRGWRSWGRKANWLRTLHAR